MPILESPLDLKHIRMLHKSLCEKIFLYRKHYFDFATPLVDDSIYDSEYKYLLELESKYWQYLDIKISPTQVIGLEPTHLKPVKHISPMLSLNNGWYEEDIRKFFEHVSQSSTNGICDIVCEPKIDGISASLYYQKGMLAYVLSRGDGYHGDDITKNAQYISNLPLVLKSDSVPDDLYIRAEIVLNTSLFQEINDHFKQLNCKLFSNPRNCVSGIMRQIIPNQFCLNRFHIYGYGIEKSPNLDHLTDLEYLASLNFPIINNVSRASRIKDMIDYFNVMLQIKLEYQIDGVVYKANTHAVRQQMGFTNQAPRWAIAYKFPNHHGYTCIREIIFQIGRTGVMTPIAIVNPIRLDGVMIHKLTLHNIDIIKTHNINIGSEIIIKRAGGVIPTFVLNISKEVDNHYTFPRQCSFCNADLQVISKKLVCFNHRQCIGQKIERISFFVSKACFNIHGCSRKIIELLLKTNKIIEAYHLFDLSAEDLSCLEGFGKKKITNLLTAIQNSRMISLEKFIFALGINGVGSGAAKQLASRAGTWEIFKNYNIEEIMLTHTIGIETATSINTFLHHADHQLYLDSLWSRIKIHSFDT